MQYVRDESHRFAQHYHHILRRKSHVRREGRLAEGRPEGAAAAAGVEVNAVAIQTAVSNVVNFLTRYAAGLLADLADPGSTSRQRVVRRGLELALVPAAACFVLYSS